MPAIAKNPDDRQRRNAPAILDGAGPALPAPAAPPRLTAKLRRRWAELWASPLAGVFDPVSDAPALERLFALYRLGESLDVMVGDAARLQRRIRKPATLDPLELAELIVEHAAARDTYLRTVAARVRISTELRMLEAQVGMSPRSRVVLGVALAAAGKGVGLDDAASAADE